MASDNDEKPDIDDSLLSDTIFYSESSYKRKIEEPNTSHAFESSPMKKTKSILSEGPSMASTSQAIDFPERGKHKLIFNGRYFTVTERLNTSKFHKDRFGIIARCEICKLCLKGSLDVTSNYIKHLKCAHNEAYLEYLELKDKTSSKRKLRTKQGGFNTKVLNFIIDIMSPVCIVEKKSFIDLFDGTDLKVMSISEAITLLHCRYTTMMNNIKSKMTDVKYFCTTVDIWRSEKRNFLGYTCHWLDDNFKRNSVALTCKLFYGSDTRQHIRDILSKTKNRFGFDHTNMITTITDNVCSFLKVFKEYGVAVPSQVLYQIFDDIPNYNDSDDSDGYVNESEDEVGFENTTNDILSDLPKYQHSPTYLLNLLGTSDFLKCLQEMPNLLQTHIESFEKCSHLWRKASSTKGSEVILCVLKITLSCPVLTRWDSLFYSIQKILDVKEKLNTLCGELMIPKFTQSDLNYLEEYCYIMRPLAETLSFLRSDRSTLFGYLIPSLVTLQTKLWKIYSSDRLKLLKPIAIALEKCLKERFQSYFLLTSDVNEAIAASVLCPDIKLKCFPALKNTAIDCSPSYINSVVLKYARSLGGNDYSENAPSKEKKHISFFDFGEEDVTDLYATGDSPYESKLEKEYYLYLADPSADIKMLDRYPILKNLSWRVNTALTSSGPVEKLFSLSTIINALQYSLLSDNNFEKIALMKANKDMIPA